MKGEKSEKQKKEWMQTLQESKDQLRNQIHLPTNGLIYELELIIRAIPLVVDSSEEGVKALQEVGKEIVNNGKFPSIDSLFSLLKGVGKGTSFFIKKGVEKQQAALLQKIFTLELSVDKLAEKDFSQMSIDEVTKVKKALKELQKNSS